MANVDARINGTIAHLDGVQAYMDLFEEKAAAKAEALLAEHEATSDPWNPAEKGQASIETAKEGPDRYIILSDDRGRQAAVSIEYGHDAYDVYNEDGSFAYHVGKSDGTYILHKAVGITIKGREPHLGPRTTPHGRRTVRRD